MPIPIPPRRGLPPLLAVLLLLATSACGPAPAPGGGTRASSRLPFPEAELRAFLLPRLGDPFAEEAGNRENVRLTAESQPATGAAVGAGVLRVTFKVEHTLGENRYGPVALVPSMVQLYRGADPDAAFRSALARVAGLPEPASGRLRADVVDLSGIEAGADGGEEVFGATTLRDLSSFAPPSGPRPTRLPAGPMLLTRTAPLGQKLVAYGTCLARRTIDIWAFSDMEVSRVDGQLPLGKKRDSFPAAGVLTLDSPEGTAYVRAQAERRQRVTATVENALADLNRRLEARLRALESAGAMPLPCQLRRPPIWGTDKVRPETWRVSLRVGAPVPAGTDAKGHLVAPGALALSGEVEEPGGACTLQGELRDGVVSVGAVEVLRAVPGADYGAFAAFRLVLVEGESNASATEKARTPPAAHLLGTLTDNLDAPLTIELPAAR